MAVVDIISLQLRSFPLAMSLKLECHVFPDSNPMEHIFEVKIAQGDRIANLKYKIKGKESQHPPQGRRCI